MLGREVAASPDASLAPSEILLDLGADAESSRLSRTSLEDDSFEVSRQGGDDGSIAIRAASSRGLIHAAADVAGTLIRGCKQLTILATTREALGIPGETLFRLPSLSAGHDPKVLAPAEVEL